jgi:hypothetical protein
MINSIKRANKLLISLNLNQIWNNIRDLLWLSLHSTAKKVMKDVFKNLSLLKLSPERYVKTKVAML